MNRPYTAHSPYSLTPTERISTYSGSSGPALDDRHGSSYETDYGPGYDRGYDLDYDGFEDTGELAQLYDEARIDRRWMWIAGIAGVILFIAIGTTGVILGGGDSGSVSATVAPDATTSAAPATTSPKPPAAGTPAAPLPSLPPETVTTVTPTAETTPVPVQPAPTTAAAPPPAAPAPAPNTVTYRVTGNHPLIDLVTVIYTDQQGALQTEVNVALPWTKTVVLNPGVQLGSVTATSVAGQLNCAIIDGSGALVAAQNSNSMITTCTK